MKINHDKKLLKAGLGKKPDTVVAGRVGLSSNTVRKIRHRLGIPPFNGVLLTQEGKPCRSIYEAKYDAWLHWKGVDHKHEVKVPGLPFIADFKVGDTYVEIVGMLGFAKYAEKVRHKHKEYDKAGIPCQWFGGGSVEYLFTGCPVPLRFRRERKCKKCKKNIQDLVNGMCRRCNHRDWVQRNAIPTKCQQCKEWFMKHPGSPRAKFCSRKCYWKSMEGTPLPHQRKK